MAQSTLPDRPLPFPHEATFEQIACGDNILQIGSIHGSIVNIATTAQQPQFWQRSTPVLILPRAFPALLDRQVLVEGAIAAFQTRQSVEFYGEAGIGKSALLRHLAYQPQVTAGFPDGAIYLLANQQPIPDLLQALFDAFYETSLPYKPADTQIRHALIGKRVLVLLDGGDHSRSQVEALINALPGYTFLLTSPDRRLWGEGQSMLLPGLPLADALLLIERELGRSLTADETSPAQKICQALEGNPDRILQAIALVRTGNLSLTDIARSLQSSDSPGVWLAEQLLSLLPKPQRWIIASLMALGGVALLAEQTSAMTGLPNAGTLLQNLVQSHLVQVIGDRYCLSSTLMSTLQPANNLNPWLEQAVAYFLPWAEEHQNSRDRLLAEKDALLRLFDWTVQNSHWADALRLARVLEGALAAGRQWDIWGRVLQSALQAAEALQDQGAIAWALHQSGTRALCLEDLTTAREQLTQALHLRESLGDQAGAAVTRHNLDLLLPVPPESSPEASPEALPVSPPERSRLWLWRISALLPLLVGGLLVWWMLKPQPPPTPTPTLSPAPSSTIAPLPSASFSLSPTALTFNRRGIGTSSQPQPVTLTNQSTTALAIADWQLSGNDSQDFRILSNQCKGTLAPGDTCTVSLQFQPTAIGPRRATLAIVTANPPTANPSTVPLPTVLLNGEGRDRLTAQSYTLDTQPATPVSLNLLSRDRDPDGNPLAVTQIGQGKNGSVRRDQNGRVTYTPNPGFAAATDTFAYTVTNNQGETATGTVTIAVAAPSRPIARGDRATVDYIEQPSITVNVLTNDKDPNNGRLAIADHTNGQYGSVTVNEDQTLTYSPDWRAVLAAQSQREPGTSLSDRFQYTVRNEQGERAIATVRITYPRNRDITNPIANDDSASLSIHQQPSISINVLANDRDPAGGQLTITSQTNGRFGSVTLNPDQTLIYTLTSNPLYATISQSDTRPPVTDSFQYTIRNTQGGTATATVTITLTN